MEYKRILIIFVALFSFSAVSQDANQVKSINFIQEGEISKLIITLEEPTIPILNHVKEDKQLILDIKNVTAEKKFLRGIDTSEFSGSIDYISPYKKPGSNNDLRFAIQLRDNVRSILNNKENKIILNIENRFGVFSKRKVDKQNDSAAVNLNPLQGSSKKVLTPKSKNIIDILENLTQSGVKRYVGKKISINVNNVPYPEILKMISNTSGFNIIIADEIKALKPLTLSLTNLPWDRVLDTIMDLGDLAAFRHGNILSVTTQASARKDKEEELQDLKKSRILEPLVTRIFPISYAKMEDLSKILKDYSSEKRGTIQSDERTRNLIVKDTVDVIERMKKIIETLDTQNPQVLISAKIVEANENYEFIAGLGKGGLSFGYDPVTAASSLEDSTGSFSFSSATDSDNPTLLGADITVFKRLLNLDFKLQLMESESKGKIISSPKIITENNQEAKITSIEERRFRVTTASEGEGDETGLEKIEASVALTVKPKVTNEGAISMEVKIEKSGFTGEATPDGIPNLLNRSIDTKVLVENGSTIVIGGVYQTTDSKIESGVPFLKDLPLLGWLFRSAYNPRKIRSELIIFLTPRIINQEEAGLVNTELSNIGI